MKKAISVLSFMFVIGLLSLNAQCCKEPVKGCKSEKSTAVKDQSKTDVQVYYFHATRRCATCQAVETVTREALKEYYGDKVSFSPINRDKEKENPMIKKYKVTGQSLLIIKGDKVVNLTTNAFMNARTKPEKLKAKIKSTIDSMI